MQNDELPNRSLSSIVIVAEKYPLSRAALADLLTCDGYRVFQTDNANSAMLLIQRYGNPATLLTDLEMPGWKSLVRHTRRTAPNALIIAMLESHSTPDFSDLRQRGIGLWFVKPLEYEDIHRAIRSRERQPGF